MQKCPYRILKLKRTATQEEIVKAYRREAKKHHPDRGGDQKLFIMCQWAYDLLCDEARRARYDADGDVSEPRPDNGIGETLTYITPIMADALQQGLKAGIPLSMLDLLNGIKTILGKRKEGCKTELLHKQKCLDAMKYFAKEVKVKEGENHFASLCQTQEAVILAEMEMVDKHLAMIGKCQEFLQNYTLTPQGMWTRVNGATVGAYFLLS